MVCILHNLKMKTWVQTMEHFDLALISFVICNATTSDDSYEFYLLLLSIENWNRNNAIKGMLLVGLFSPECIPIFWHKYNAFLDALMMVLFTILCIMQKVNMISHLHTSHVFSIIGRQPSSQCVRSLHWQTHSQNVSRSSRLIYLRAFSFDISYE